MEFGAWFPGALPRSGMRARRWRSRSGAGFGFRVRPGATGCDQSKAEMVNPPPPGYGRTGAENRDTGGETSATPRRRKRRRHRQRPSPFILFLLSLINLDSDLRQQRKRRRDHGTKGGEQRADRQSARRGMGTSRPHPQPPQPAAPCNSWISHLGRRYRLGLAPGFPVGMGWPRMKFSP